MRRSIIALTITGIILFCSYIPLNNKGAADAHELAMNSVDESFQYPFLIHMITPGETAAETRWRILSYGHYIYGYPFYVASALTALPVQLSYGESTPEQVQLIVLLERQFVSVLPMLLAIGIFTYLVTRLRSAWLSVPVFLFLSTIPGIVRQNIWWWHPDALAILCVALTFFFLDKDDSQFGRNFFISAFFCGLVIGIKTIGVFFAPVIGYLLISGLIQKQISWKKVVLYGLGFIAVMVAIVFISNPLLFIESARERIIRVHVDHNYFFTHGWADDDPYGVGWNAWEPVLNGWYAPNSFLVFGLIALLWNTFKGSHTKISRLFLAWILPYSIYVIYVIAVKPDHYWMPVMLPFFAGMFFTIEYFWTRFREERRKGSARAVMYFTGGLFTFLILVSQFWFNLTISWAVYANAL